MNTAITSGTQVPGPLRSSMSAVGDIEVVHKRIHASNDILAVIGTVIIGCKTSLARGMVII